MALTFKTKQTKRGFDEIMEIPQAKDLIEEWKRGGINVSLNYGRNQKRAGSKARARFGHYMSATTLQEYINLTNDSEGNWPRQAQEDLAFDIAKGLVTYSEPKSK